MVFIDSNVPMYLAGAEHQHKVDAQRLLERLIIDGRRLVSDAEVLQEVLHRYVAINRRDSIQHAFDMIGSIVDDFFAIEVEDVRAAQALVTSYSSLSARDCLHLAVMRRHGISEIFTFDQDFDGIPDIRRLRTD